MWFDFSDIVFLIVTENQKVKRKMLPVFSSEFPGY